MFPKNFEKTRKHFVDGKQALQMAIINNQIRHICYVMLCDIYKIHKIFSQ